MKTAALMGLFGSTNRCERGGAQAPAGGLKRCRSYVFFGEGRFRRARLTYCSICDLGTIKACIHVSKRTSRETSSGKRFRKDIVSGAACWVSGARSLRQRFPTILVAGCI